MEMRWKIIVFEEDPEYAKILKETLTIEGFDVVWIDHSPRHLEELVLQERPDVITVNTQLSGADGFVLAARIKRDLRLQHIPIVFLSSMSHPMDVQRGREIGAVDYLIKSKTMPRDVANRLKTVLGQPVVKTQPKVRVTPLPDVRITPTEPVRERRSVLPNRRWWWIAGVTIVAIAGVQLSFLFSRSKPTDTNPLQINGIPIAYVDPTACVTDQDCQMLPGCCTATTVNQYHLADKRNLKCPAAICATTNLGVACLNNRCMVVTANEVTPERVVYGIGERTALELQLDAYDCTKRSGTYNECDPYCPEGATDCSTPACASVCIEQKNVLPNPGERQ